MLITPQMPLPDLAERMGGCATVPDAARLRDLLLASHPGADTADIAPADWGRLLDRSLTETRETAGDQS